MPLTLVRTINTFCAVIRNLNIRLLGNALLLSSAAVGLWFTHEISETSLPIRRWGFLLPESQTPWLKRATKQWWDETLSR